jgi:hypothetical protein
MTFIVEKENTQEPEEQSPEQTEEGHPTPDPERDDNGGNADDVPTAD